MECMSKTIMLMLIFFASLLNAMQDDADEWLKAAQRAYEKTEGVQQVNEEKDAQHEAREKLEKLEQAESPEATQEEYDEADFDENDPATWFSECPEQRQPLTCDYFKRKRYFQRAVSLPQGQKNDILADLNKDCALKVSFEREYSANRCKTAGWVCAGADPNTKGKRHSFLSTILEPAEQNDYWLIKILLEHRLNPNETICRNRPPLYWTKKKEIAELLIKHGAELEICCDGLGGTLLHRSADQDYRSDLLEYYIQQKVPINAINTVRETALHILSGRCYAHSHEELIKKARLLFKAGIDIDAKDIREKSAQGLLQECQKNESFKESSKETCKLLYDLIEEERNNRLKQFQKNGGDHGMHV